LAARPTGLAFGLLRGIALAGALVLLVVVVSDELLRHTDGGWNGDAEGRAGNDLLAGRHSLVVVVFVLVLVVVLVLVLHLDLHCFA
jgi:hypothetical protein